MTARIDLNNPPEFYTNLDTISGRILLSLHRPESIGAIIVKLEGDATTAIGQSYDSYSCHGEKHQRRPPPASLPTESHKILYKVQQAFPPENQPTDAPISTITLNPGLHEFPFEFRIPFNNACGDSAAMASLGGLVGVGGFGSGLRVMDGSKQLFLKHVLRTLPPSLTGLQGTAEVRYYVKVTVQRPGILRENWRSHVGFRFMPIEEPRMPPTTALAYARRPFVFSQRYPDPRKEKKRGKKDKNKEGGDGGEVDVPQSLPPTVEVAALLPHPPILTCNMPIPLRLIATKKSASAEPVYLVALEITLIGLTHIQCHEATTIESNRWIIFSQAGLCIPVLSDPETQLGTEIPLPDESWRNLPLPNTVHPSFTTCNLSRCYELEIRIGLSRDCPSSPGTSSAPPVNGFTSFFKSPSSLSSSSKDVEMKIPLDIIMLPLKFSDLSVFSGIAPPQQLLREIERRQSIRPSTMHNNQHSHSRRTSMNHPSSSSMSTPTSPTGHVYSPGHASSAFADSLSSPFVRPPSGSMPTSPSYPVSTTTTTIPTAANRTNTRPPLPPRRAWATEEAAATVPPYDPLYPPQMGTPAAAGWEEAPPSYEDVLMEGMGDLSVGRERPAYSGMTDVNAPSVGTGGKGGR